MKASFDGVRKQMADQYNALAETELSEDQHRIMLDLQTLMVALLCMEEPRDQPGDCNSLIGEITVKDPRGPNPSLSDGRTDDKT